MFLSVVRWIIQTGLWLVAGLIKRVVYTGAPISGIVSTIDTPLVLSVQTAIDGLSQKIESDVLEQMRALVCDHVVRTDSTHRCLLKIESCMSDCEKYVIQTSKAAAAHTARTVDVLEEQLSSVIFKLHTTQSDVDRLSGRINETYVKLDQITDQIRVIQTMRL
jgi:hypothetical protein